MHRKILVYSLRVFAGLFLLVSFLMIVAVRLSDKGDIVDRNSGCIVMAFLIAMAIFIYSVLILEERPKSIYRKKTSDELVSEIRKSNINRIKQKNQIPKNAG